MIKLIIQDDLKIALIHKRSELSCLFLFHHPFSLPRPFKNLFSIAAPANRNFMTLS